MIMVYDFRAFLAARINFQFWLVDWIVGVYYDWLDWVNSCYVAGRCLEDSPYADVCFLVHGEPVNAHRVILSARSSYFAHMFETKWRDRRIIELKHRLVRQSAW